MQSTLLNSPHGLEPNAYTDFGDLAALRRDAQQAPDTALAAVARQFESLFIKMMLSSMRQASSGDPLFDSHQSELYRDMFDNQIALDMAQGKGIGLAESLVGQLRRYLPANPVNANASPAPVTSAVSTVPRGSESRRATAVSTSPMANDASVGSTAKSGKVLQASFDGPESFVRQLWPQARQAARELGVAPEVLLAQAALETGWGQAILRHDDGRSSHNLFNIKADARWNGDSVGKQTLEYRDGLAQREAARFRSYDSYAASFRDYVEFLQTQPRYAGALQVAGDAGRFVQALQDAGYATDPARPDPANPDAEYADHPHPALAALAEQGTE
jgi:flagellar protein FlgJ